MHKKRFRDVFTEMGLWREAGLGGIQGFSEERCLLLSGLKVSEISKRHPR